MSEYEMNFDAAFGIAGNFTGHLEQAGESASFAGTEAAPGVPKAVFPTYIRNAAAGIPEFLGTFPFSSSRIVLPAGGQKVQMEPECAVVFRAIWSEDRLAALVPEKFGASDDCSVRKPGACRISTKKNWGRCSKGLAADMKDIDTLDEGGILDSYRISGLLVRNGKVHVCGEDSAIRDYSCFHGKLAEWIAGRMNLQTESGPAENVGRYMNMAGHPERMMVSIGATRYTPFGESCFLEPGDTAAVILYHEDMYTADDVAGMAAAGYDSLPADGLSVLVQKVVSPC